MRIALWIFLLSFARQGLALPQVGCHLDYSGNESSIVIQPEGDALNGHWQELGPFKLRGLLAAPTDRPPWLLLEVYALAADDDYRMISSQKISPPFSTGAMEVIEPMLGRSLHYDCRERQ